VGIYLFAAFNVACGVYIIATARRTSERESDRGGFFHFTYSVSNVRFVGFGFCFIGLASVVAALLGLSDT
jgi:hypothetical protein